MDSPFKSDKPADERFPASKPFTDPPTTNKPFPDSAKSPFRDNMTNEKDNQSMFDSLANEIKTENKAIKDNLSGRRTGTGSEKVLAKPAETPKAAILRECGGLESNIPINSPYWTMDA